MNSLRYFLVWILTFVFVSLIDALWHLGLFGKIYSQGIRPLARLSGNKITFNALSGILSQVLVVSCLVFLVLYKARKNDFLEAVLIGAIAGILAITVYGLVNYALFRDWSLKLTILEVIWGPILGGIGGMFIYWLKFLLLNKAN